MVNYVGGVDMGSWLCCGRVAIGTEGWVGGVLVILFKNNSESGNKLV